MDLKTLHKRVVKLEKLVGQLSKWTHFNPGAPYSEVDEHEDQEPDDFLFEILPDQVDDDDDDQSRSASGGSASGDDSDYSPSLSSKKRKKMSKSRKSGTEVSTSAPTSGSGKFTWTLPTSSSVQRALAITANANANTTTTTSTSTTAANSESASASTSATSNPDPNANAETNNQSSSILLKTEVDFADEFNENDDLHFHGLLYPDQGGFDDDENGRIQVIPSQQGRPMVEKDGYLFQCDRPSNSKIIYRCDRHKTSRCPVRLHTNKDLENPRLLLFTGEHTHPPNPHAAEVRKVVAVIRQDALTHRSTPPEEIIEKCLQQLPPELKDYLPRMDALRKSIRNVRGEIGQNTKPRRKIPATSTSASAQVEGDNSNSNSNSNSATATTTASAASDWRLAPQTQPLQLIETRRGKPKLEKGGYLFHLERLGKKRIWRCVRNKTCPVRIHTTLDLGNLEELGQLGEHSHPPNSMTHEVRRVMVAIRHDALTTSLTANEILANYLPQLPPEAKEMLRTDSVKRQIRKARESLNSDTGTSTGSSDRSQQKNSQNQNSSNSNVHRPPEESILLPPFPPPLPHPHPHPHPQESPPSLLLLSSFGGQHSHSSGPGWVSFPHNPP